MSTDNPVQVVLKFEELINGRNADTIAAFMAADGEFIDSLGNRIQGTEKLRSAWAGYFKMVPDYSISHSEIFADGNIVALFGSAQGTFAPAASGGQGEAGVPGTRGVRVQGLEAGSRAEPAAQGAETTELQNTPQRVGAERQNFWKTPAAWRAVVKDGRISIWQVYADNEPIRAIMRKGP
jgi:SnoaL-like domain